MKIQSSWLVALLIIPLLGITGCKTTTVKILSEPVNSVALNPPNIRDLELQGIKWFIVTPENIDEVFKELEDVRGLAATSAGAATFQTSSDLSRDLNLVVGQTAPSGWITKGRDVALEQAFLRRLQGKF